MGRFMLAFVLVSSLWPDVGCGSKGGGGDGGGVCTPTAICRPGEVTSDPPCADCRSQDDGCGGTLLCGPDPTCTVPCPAGEYQVFGDCPDATSCVDRVACGQAIVCRDQKLCLAEESCPDGGFLLEACPAGLANCLPYSACGVQRFCPTLSGCEQVACSPGEAPTVLACSDPSIVLPCREVTACAGSVACVCSAAQSLCRLDETFDTAPCTPGQECRTLQVCGTTVYCKGDSI